MKRRRTMIVSLLLVAALALGVGYAAVAGELLIHGDMTVIETPGIDVKFSAVTGTEYPVLDDSTLTYQLLSTQPTDTDGQLQISFKATNFQTVGDEVVINYTIKNFSTTTAQIDNVVLTTDGSDAFDSEYFTITRSDPSGQLDAGDTVDGSITIHLDQAYHGTDEGIADESIEEFFVLTISTSEVGAP